MGAPKHALAPRVRGAFLRALEIIEDERGLTFSQLVKKEIEEHGLLTVLDKVGKYVERTSQVDVTTRDTTLIELLTEAERWSRKDTSVEEQPESVRH